MKKWFLIFFLVTPFLGSFAQSAPATKFDPKRIRNELKRIDSLLFNERGDLISQQKESDETQVNEVVEKWVDQQKRVFNANTGLLFNASYNYKFGDKIVGDDFDDIRPYANRLQLSISWDLLNSSLVGKNLAYQRANLQGKKTYYDLAGQLYRNVLSDTKKSLEYRLNSSYNILLACKKDILSYQVYIQEFLNAEDRILEGEMLTARHQLLLLDGKMRFTGDQQQELFDLGQYMSRQEVFDNLKVKELLASDYEQMKLETELLLLENEKLSSTYLNEIKIAPFVRGQIYDRGTQRNTKGNVDLGVNVSLPITSRVGAKRQEIEARIELTEVLRSGRVSQLEKRYSDRVEVLNQNLVTLRASVDALEYLKNRLLNSQRLLEAQKISLNYLLEEYKRYIDRLMSVYELIEAREIILAEIMSGMHESRSY